MNSFGSVYYNDMKLNLQQDPYLDDSKKYYKAYALDEHNRQWRIIWKPLEGTDLWEIDRVEEV